ncbi:hypothetical protein DICPUDRAFT_156567 [Dictyostelium purpureum]|uniref:Uncharacterized protein n=1 Tax=Dictyostelium purpureum TaxID=5786 RepID=F0ZWX0_DICPU|nr:uncharacterized protein DICPUDRAFT_156567 [Dictyostelium purpureum]EGC31573.1 hypothetical protein DICPUDRAFT_156567 [Dictyostelium purpureum]|eukprot:XP_003291915.1 hypothetical protein DICPUDRAFT_156567 [Dictyostelium purpureum]
MELSHCFDQKLQKGGHNKSYHIELVPIVGAFGRIIMEEVSYTLIPNSIPYVNSTHD